MTRHFSIPVEFPGEEEIQMIPIVVELVYGNHGIGTYEYWGSTEYDYNVCYAIDEILWEEQKYTKEQNQAILEAVLRDESMILQAINEEDDI